MTNLIDINPSLIEYAHRYLQRFMTINIDELKMLLSYCEIRQVEKRTILVKEGEVDNYLNMVVKGLVMKYVRVKKSDMILQLATEGHVIHSEISFLTRTPSLVFVETLEPTIMVSLTYDKMEEALDKFPQGERLGRLILTGMYVKKEESRYYRLLRSPRERFLDYINAHPHMLQRVPQKYLASYLNIKPETFSRMKHLVAKQ
ncbi:MAG TPA: cyclic nucleotide-binding domain-containing protein [Chitinophagaceae bacterium]|nr:cyclic nucleotide-binding domain-containing protein [Chitinophagaceae bacterium]